MLLGLHKWSETRFTGKLSPDFIDRFEPIYNERRFSHTVLSGKSGFGKSTAMERLATRDILAGEGLMYVDPHGDSIDNILKRIPPERRRDVILLDPSIPDWAISFNPIADIPPEQRPYVASSIVEVFKCQWADSWGPQLEQFLYNGVAALLDTPGATLMDLKFLITSKKYRRYVVGSKPKRTSPATCKRTRKPKYPGHVLDPIVREFWQTDFAEHMPEKEQRDRTLSTLNKIGSFINSPALRHVLCQPKNRLDLKDIMSNRKILLVRLAQGQIGKDKSSLLGSLLIASVHLAALSRRKERTPFHVYIDECSDFAAPTLVAMLKGIRKFGVSMVLAYQYLDLLAPELKAAIKGTVETLVSFRMGVDDARVLAGEFRLDDDDIPFPDLPPFIAYARTGGQTILLHMPPVWAPIYAASARKVEQNCRVQFGTSREIIEKQHGDFINST